LPKKVLSLGRGQDTAKDEQVVRFNQLSDLEGGMAQLAAKFPGDLNSGAGFRAGMNHLIPFLGGPGPWVLNSIPSWRRG
jgi:hypothetical protein